MDKKFSELTEATSFNSADIIPIVQSSANKKITFGSVFQNVSVPMSVNTSKADQDTSIYGTGTPPLIFAKASTNSVGVGTSSPNMTLDVAGSLGLDGIVVNSSIDTLTSSGAVSLVTYTTVLDVASATVATLGAGQQGQTKEIVSANIGPVTLTPSGLASGTTITFSAVGDTVTLKYIGTSWYVMAKNGAVVA